MTNTTLKQLCNSVIESAAKAIKTPYFCSQYPHLDDGKSSFGKLECSEYTHDYIVLAANNAEKLALALDEILLAAERLLPGLKIVERAQDDDGLWTTREKSLVTPETEALRKALAKAEELLK